MRGDLQFLLALLAVAAVGCEPSDSVSVEFPWWEVGPAPDDDPGDDVHEDGIEALWFGSGMLAPRERFDGSGGFAVIEYEGGDSTVLCRVEGAWTSTMLRFDCADCEFAFELEWSEPAVEIDEDGACLTHGVNPGALPQEPLLLGFGSDTAWSFDGDLWVEDGYADVDGDVCSWEIPPTF